ncbi:DUF1345 domain-containing protein [Massilia sp. YIM B02763]|uniref:DUF1345 domain-containing protein n=1 Tax=Massilia sp. YIM B02763 TaxID=3050130 RepID=UPI0025B6C280|nr:DUF1345 domain-containing protein [Massilia sp. YIM B02763]MDN4053168.1 DUF1345 domain-containing protein [Massilia sp. YIM B02763]
MGRHRHHGSRPARFVRARPHLVLGVVFGLAVALLLPGSHPWVWRALVGWNSGVWTYLASMAWMMARADHRQVRAVAERQDESARAVLTAMVLGAILSLYAIVTELARMGKISPDEAALHYAFTVLTVIGSWLLVGVLFALHYGHLYYCSEDAGGPPLRFPDDALEPNYWDFLYFSFTISVAVQTSDVSIRSRPMRKLVLGHSVLAFFFNLVILGLSINIAASVVNN